MALGACKNNGRALQKMCIVAFSSSMWGCGFGSFPADMFVKVEVFSFSQLILRYSEDDNDKKSKYSVCVQRQNHEKFGHMTVAYLGPFIPF